MVAVYMMNSIFCLLQITLIDVVLSGDNMGIIGLAVRNLPKDQARKANLIGVIGAICMRVIFASIITTILMIEWLPIKLAGGILLLEITWNMMNLKEDENEYRKVGKRGFWTAVYNIIIADMSVSFDNVLAIGGIAKGNLWMIIFGLLVNIPIIFYGSQLIVKLIKRYKITVYIGSGILAHTALDMILEDKLISPYFSLVFSRVFPWIIAVLIMIYGVYAIRNKMKPKIRLI